MGWFVAGVVLVVYEGVALSTNRVPTLTALMRRLPEQARIVIVGSIATALLDHFDSP